MTIEALPGVLAFIHPPGCTPAVTVNAGSTAIVVLRGLTLSVGPVHGVQVDSVDTLHVENCVIKGFDLNGIHFNTAGKLFVKDTS